MWFSRNIALLSAFIGILAVSALPKDNMASLDSGKMSHKEALKPFGLDTKGLNSVKIFLAVYVPKSGMGKEQLEILGNGTVRLIRSDNYQAPDKILEGKVDPEGVAALLALFEREDFMALETAYTTKSPIKTTRQIKLTLPSGEKSVHAESGSEPQAFVRLLGAVRVLVGMGDARALSRQYFPYL